MNKEQLGQTWKKFWKNRDTKSKKQLVEHYYSYVLKVAGNLSRRFNYRVDQIELASHGLKGLYRAIDYYDVGREVKFETYSYSRIKGAMIDGIRSEDWVPRSVRLRQAAIEKEVSKNESIQGEKVASTSVLDSIGIDESEFHRNHKKFCAASVASFESTLCPNIDSGENKKDFNRYLIGERESDPDDIMLRKEFLSKLMGKDFTDMERKTIYYHYYEGSTMKDIAGRFDISESRMSQIHRDILRRLKLKVRKNPDYFSSEVLSVILNNNTKANPF